MQAHNRLTLRIFFFLWVIVSVSVSAELPQPYKQLISKYNFKKDSYKTTNVNILLNRVRLDKKRTLKKRIVFSIFLVAAISSLIVYFVN